jgi:hypothetical protein
MKEGTIERDRDTLISHALTGVASFILMMGGVASPSYATTPCEDFDECKVLVEINATDGDIGFHWLVDAEGLNSTRIDDANGAKVYQNKAYGPLKDQKLTETFGESAEPVCKELLKEEEDDVVVTVTDFVERWPSGDYDISGNADGGEQLAGETQLTHWLPAAPDELSFTQATGLISWMEGDDLGECATSGELTTLVNEGILPAHPVNVFVSTWEVVFEVEDFPNLNVAVRIPYDAISGPPFMLNLPTQITAILPILPDNTLAKVEVGAIGGNLDDYPDDDNATFSETEICLNDVPPPGWDSGCFPPEEPEE